jgi:hypothetical protein
MGLISGSQVETSDINHYLDLFKEWLFVEQAQQLGDLFTEAVPTPEEGEIVGS